MMTVLEELLLSLPNLRNQHIPGSEGQASLKQKARREVEKLFYEEKPEVREFRPFGDLIFPYYKMGAIDSLNLFDFNELVIFSFYWANRQRYRRVADIGANIGLHAVLLSKCGFQVRSYEPDPGHFKILQRNLELNNCLQVQAFNTAVSSKDGEMEFVKVLGNTTGSHLAGAKSNPYGDLQRFPVKVEAIDPIIDWADLIKLDVEGHEKEIISVTHVSHWLTKDALVEVHDQVNAKAIYNHFAALGVNLFSQKTGWRLVGDFKDVPTSYKEGILFVTSKKQMPWR